MVTLVDTMNMVFMAFHMSRKQLHDSGEQLTDDNMGFFAHMFFNKVNSVVSTYDNVYFCWEGRGSLDYRRQIFPDYKGNRKAQKDEDEYKALERFFPAMEEALQNYPIKHIRVDGGEADDAIYALSKKYAETEDEVLILSSDKDLTQIKHSYPNVVVYNPIFKKVITSEPTIVAEKSICGDASDNIPGLYRIGPKTFQKMLADKVEWNKIMKKDNNQKLYETFRKIIDLSLYPEEYHNRVLEADEAIAEQPTFQPDKLELFFWDLKMKDMLNRWEKIKSEIYLKIGMQRVEQEIVERASETEKIDLPPDEEADELDKIIADYV